MKKYIFVCGIIFTLTIGSASAFPAWLADFLCGGDNDVRVCKSHLPGWALTADLTDASANDPKFQKLKQDFAKQKDEKARRSLLERNRSWIQAAAKKNSTKAQ